MELFFLVIVLVILFNCKPSKKKKSSNSHRNATQKQENIGCLGSLWHGVSQLIKVILILFGILFFIAFISVITDDDTQNTEQSSVTATTQSTVRPTSTTIPTKQPTIAPTATLSPTPTPTEEVPQESFFEIHFLDVGQADSALVLCDGQSMLIDGGDSKDSSLIYAYLKEHDIKHLDYIVATHGHSDHVGGLSGALKYATVNKVLCSTTNYDNEEFSDFTRYLGKRGASITVPNVGDTFTLGSANFEIIGPLSPSENHNDTSIVLRLSYGDTSFLFTGDAENEEEHEILASGRTVASTLLKVGHHGSSNSTSYKFLKRVSPEYAIISVGKDNPYGFPTQETIESLREANIKVFRTDMQGTIVCTSDGAKLTFAVERNADAETLPTATPVPTKTPKPTATPKPIEEDPETEYVLNKNTKKFHYPYCKSVDKMKEKNKVYFTGTREEVIRKGYDPCGNCHP